MRYRQSRSPSPVMRLMHKFVPCWFLTSILQLSVVYSFDELTSHWDHTHLAYLTYCKYATQLQYPSIGSAAENLTPTIVACRTTSNKTAQHTYIQEQSTKRATRLPQILRDSCGRNLSGFVVERSSVCVFAHPPSCYQNACSVGVTCLLNSVAVHKLDMTDS